MNAVYTNKTLRKSETERLNEAAAFLADKHPEIHNIVFGESRVKFVFGDPDFWDQRPDSTGGTCCYEETNGKLTCTVHIRTMYSDGSLVKLKTGVILHECIHAASWIAGAYFEARKFGRTLKISDEEIGKLSVYAQNSWHSCKFGLQEEPVAEFVRAEFNAYKGVESAVKVFNACTNMQTWLRMYALWCWDGPSTWNEAYKGKSFT